MNLNSLLSAFMGNDTLASIASVSNTSAGDVASVLAAALPSLLAGASAQANNKETAESFAEALNTHSADTSVLASLVDGIDVKDGKKVVEHLLGADTKATTDSIASATGVSKTNTSTILAVAAPLLLSLLSNNSSNNTTSSATSLLSSLLGGSTSNSSNGSGINTASVMAIAAPLLINALTNNSNSSSTSVNTSSATSLLGSLLGGLTGSTDNSEESSSDNSLLSGLMGLLK